MPDRMPALRRHRLRLKNKLERLAPTVRRAIKEAEERSNRKRAKRTGSAEKYFRTLTEHSLEVLTILNAEGLFLYTVPHSKLCWAIAKDVAGQSAFELVHPEICGGSATAFQRALENPGEVITTNCVAVARTVHVPH